MPNRKPYAGDVPDEERAFVALCQAPIREDSPQRSHDLPPEFFDALRWEAVYR